MKKAFVALFCAAVLLTSFSTPSRQSVGKPYAVMALKQTANAQPYNVQSTWDFTGSVFSNPCGTGESILVSGVAHINIHGVYNSATNTYTDYFHGNFQGITAIGATSGSQYHLQDVLNEKVRNSYLGCILTVSYVESVTFVAVGSQENLVAKYTFSYSYNFCTGEYSSSRELISQSCH